MLRFYYNPRYKYTNREIINLLGDDNFVEKDYQNIDSPDTINGHIIYKLSRGESIPSYIFDTENNRRYFVSGITQLRSGKFQISLLRDIISENPLLWKEEESYISAGHAENYNKYKRWNLPFTNTKVDEQRLNINGKSSFFVYYVNTQDFQGNVVSEHDLEIKSTSIPNITGYDLELNNINEIPHSQLLNAGNVSYFNAINFIMGIVTSGDNLNSSWLYKKIREGESTLSETSNASPGELYIHTYKNSIVNNTNNCKYLLKESFNNFFNNDYRSSITTNYNVSSSQISDLDSYVNKIILSRNNNKVYKIKKNTSTKIYKQYVSTSMKNTFISYIRNIPFPQGPEGSWPNFTPVNDPILDKWLFFNAEEKIYSYTLEELGTATGFEFNFKADTRKLPKSAVRCVNIVAGQGFENDDIAQTLMLAQTNGINENNDTGRILDIQFLPFSIATDPNENFKLNQTSLIAQFLDSDDFEFTTDLEYLARMNKETDTIKIVSPSRASQYLFRPYDNDGSMVFNTKITIKPFATVIYVRPSTQGLLLYDWNDKDCLIINEDFSLTNVSSQWTNYIYNNRSYQNAFEREIQGREFERNWERRIEQAQAKSDDWTSRNISAQKAKAYTGNIPLVSDIAGAIGTAVQDQTYMQMAQLDREYNESLYQEGLSISRDLFNMQLDNIKSQPLIPSRVTTIDVKFLDGIYLEFYSTNDTELSAIDSYYKYNGNRIDDYGTFAEYWGHFVRGKIIKSNNYTQPEIDELNRRLGMGIFTEVKYGN